MQIRRVAMLVLGSALAVQSMGCATLTDQNTMFHESHKRYTRLMRFTDFDRARSFVAPDARQAFHARTDSLRDIHFTDYAVQEIENGKTSATVTVQYTGYRSSSPVVITFSEEQLWELADNTWTVRPTLEEHAP
jgi:hypothetical protein